MGHSGRTPSPNFSPKYQNDESFSQVTVSSKMFGLFTNLEAETPEDKEGTGCHQQIKKDYASLVRRKPENARELYKRPLP
jgi:hypothetical protein